MSRDRAPSAPALAPTRRRSGGAIATAPPASEPRRANATEAGDAARLDEVSAQLGGVLAHADALLAEWASFGGRVRDEVDHATAALGDTVNQAIRDALEEAAAHAATRTAELTIDTVEAAVRRTLDERVSAQLRSLSAELGALEAKARAAAHHSAAQRRRERGLLLGVCVGLVISNLLLVTLLLRQPRTQLLAPPAAPALEATPRDAGPGADAVAAPSSDGGPPPTPLGDPPAAPPRDAGPPSGADAGIHRDAGGGAAPPRGRPRKR